MEIIFKGEHLVLAYDYRIEVKNRYGGMDSLLLTKAVPAPEGWVLKEITSMELVRLIAERTAFLENINCIEFYSLDRWKRKLQLAILKSSEKNGTKAPKQPLFLNNN